MVQLQSPLCWSYRLKFDIFSKRGKPPPDVFVYDEIPYALRVQVIHIVNRALRLFTLAPSVYVDVANILREEDGTFQLSRRTQMGSSGELQEFFLYEDDSEHVLDVVEELLKRLLVAWAHDPPRQYKYQNAISDAIVAVNRRFKEHGVGYEFVENRIIRKDSEYIHEEIVKPALKILHNKRFTGPREEFLQAHNHYRKGDHKATLNECLKALESTMKCICNDRKWKYPPNSTAAALIDVCLKNNLIPTYWQCHYSALVSLLKSGVPTGRNRLSGHGQGQKPQQVPDHIVSFMLHLTASTIVFLGDADANVF